MRRHLLALMASTFFFASFAMSASAQQNPGASSAAPGDSSMTQNQTTQAPLPQAQMPQAQQQQAPPPNEIAKQSDVPIAMIAPIAMMMMMMITTATTTTATA